MFRIGNGYDVHKLKEGRDLILGGVKIEHTMGLDGHSDADVAVHALMDALLGATALGDIGRHFPDTDERYRGASSMMLLGRVMELLNDRGYEIVNADITVIAQRPKLAPYIEDMRVNISVALKVSVDRVNVKATTEERLGFTGNEQGIAAHAVALVLEKQDM